MGNSSSSTKYTSGGASAAAGQQLKRRRGIVRDSERWVQVISPDAVKQRTALKPALAYGVYDGGGGGGASHVSLTPLTELNGWPEKLANQDIVPLLLEKETLKQLHFSKDFIRFGEFVKEWYSCSCAVVYHSQRGPLVIGSGNYVRKGIISTARHVYDELADAELSVRFFKYDIRQRSSTEFEVEQSYIDVPIIDRRNAESGLDAGFLCFYTDDEELVAQYGKVLPCPGLKEERGLASAGVSGVVRGVYALFHFAGGKPLVSVGRVDAAPEGMSWTKPVIDVHSGPGSSGAAAIGKYDSRIAGEALHVCRPKGAGYDERRFIEFSKLLKPGRYDAIEAPYKAGRRLGLFNAATLNGDGREFLKYDAARHGGRRGAAKHARAEDAFDTRKKFDCPRDEAYRFDRYGPKFAGQLQNHHIIPIDDMIYLYEYFSNLDKATYDVIRQKAKQQASSAAGTKRETGRIGEFRRDMGAIKKEQQDKETDLFLQGCKEEIVRRYARFHAVISRLTPDERPYRVFVTRAEINRAHEAKVYFSYAFWNLFQGYKNRSDDPKNDGTPDYSEKRKPIQFNPALWTRLKDDTRGLYVRLKLLQHLSGKGVRSLRVQRQEALVFDSLSSISALTRGPGRIHPFSESEWEPSAGRTHRLKSQ